MPPWLPGFARARLWQVGCWLVLGVGAALVELAFLDVLINVLRVPFWAASALAAEALILTRFAVADRWVFHHRRPTRQRLLRYQGASMGALVVYLALFNALTLVLGTGYTVAFVCGTGASFVWSLLTNFLWVWHRSNQPSADEASAISRQPSAALSQQPVAVGQEPLADNWADS